MERYEDALASWDRALELAPDLAELHHNRGSALAVLKRHDEAVMSYAEALRLRPDFVQALHNQVAALSALGRYGEALGNCNRAVALQPDYAEAYHNRGSALSALNRYEEAVASYTQALALKPTFTAALQNRGSVLAFLTRHEEAARDFARTLEIDPAFPYTKGMLVNSLLHCCDWREYDPIIGGLNASARAGERCAEPFPFLIASDSAEAQLVCARTFVADKCPPASPPLWRGERYAHERIRVAYASADLHEHATAHLMAGMFEGHDRSRFETFGISFGPDAPSPMRDRLRDAFEHFIDARERTAREIAELLRELEIDIAVDLKGYTYDARSEVFAWRAAPIQVNYLGYPGTMGADYFDYLIADEVVIPATAATDYVESVVRLPDSYQVNDSKRQIAERVPSREDAGLPATGFVFCSFNNTYKITPQVFDIWMRLLARVDGSVLWLLEGNAAAPVNLRREAAARGIAPERLVFAQRIALPEHLARHRLADLFLDTLPVNAHTTASDALWAGLPLVTCLGTTFAGRVAGSLLRAVGMPELVTASVDEYEKLAFQLALDPRRLAAMRAGLERNRAHAPLFDTERFTRHIEQAYSTMWRRQQDGQPPASFTVPPRPK
jgi:predicted O-linked N-acetylglucosamine transferase (SPINDLY family)